MAVVDMAGQTFGELTVLSRLVNNAAGSARWLCRCTCGNQAEVLGTALRKGMTKSCGCKQYSRKASDEELIAAYQDTGSVFKAGTRFGIHGSSVHERLHKLGVTKSPNIFTEEEKDRLRSEYWIAAETGKLGELALDMGRTKPFICRQARELGLTNKRRQKVYLSVWKYVGEESARIFFEQFKQSSLNLTQFCAKREFDDLGFATCMKKYFIDEWEHVIESKQIKQTWYRYGRQFEYRVRDDLKSLGYFVMRSPASKTPIDLIAVKPGVVLMVQCKTSGHLNPKGWNSIYDLAMSCGAVPVMASFPTGRGTKYQRLTARKEGYMRQPFEDFQP